jgi:hypothetical protein
MQCLPSDSSQLLVNPLHIHLHFPQLLPPLPSLQRISLQLHVHNILVRRTSDRMVRTIRSAGIQGKEVQVVAP